MLEHRAEREALGKPVGGACLPSRVLPAGGGGAEQGIERLEVVVLLVSQAGVERTVLIGHVCREELRLESRAFSDPGRGRAERGIGRAIGETCRYAAPGWRPVLHDVAHAPLEARALRKIGAALSGRGAAGASDDAAIAADADVGDRVDARGGDLVRRIPLPQDELSPVAEQPDAGIARGPEARRRAVVDIDLAFHLHKGAETLAEILRDAKADVRAVACDAPAAL